MILLALPWLLLISILIIFLLAIKKKWWLCIGCIIILCVLNYIGEVFPINIVVGKRSSAEGLNIIKIITWNIDGSNFDSTKSGEIVSIIDSLKPDIVFLSENYGSIAHILDKQLSDIQLKRAYYPDDYGHCFYSKLPLKDVSVIIAECDSQAIMVKCNASLDKINISLYGVHLSSNNFYPDKKFLPPDSISYSRNILDYLKNIKHASLHRVIETELICNEILKDKGPSIVVGDMNDVNCSACMKLFKNVGLKDGWWESGFGYGATIHHPLPYRIDHIMHNEGLKLKIIKVVDFNRLSDHDALYAEFEY
jgi:endonuclease/exonuclease/phosphatase (EEP) superfamily protein YafD